MDTANLKEIKDLAEEFWTEVEDSDLEVSEKSDMYAALEEVLVQVDWMLKYIKGE